MTSLTAVARAAAANRERRRVMVALPSGGKAIVQSGPLLSGSIAGRALPSRDWTLETAVERLYHKSALVYRAAFAPASAVGSVRWTVEVKDGAEWRADPDHELQALLENPHVAYPRQLWNEFLVLSLMLAGNSLFVKSLASGKKLPGATKARILELIPLLAQGISPVPHPAEWIARYETTTPPRRSWPAEEILRYQIPDPGNPYWGMSPLRPALSIINMDLRMVAWNLMSAENRAVPDGILTTEQNLTDQQYETVLDYIYDQWSGPQNAHLPRLATGGMKFQPTAMTPVEMDFNETRMRTREEILSAAGLPPVMAGYFENATLANADVSRRLFWEDNATPTFVERIVGGLNGHVVPHFGDPRKLRVTYDISGIPALREDLKAKFEMLRIATASGTPYNQAVKELELDLDAILPWGDHPFGLEQFRGAVVPGAPAGATGDPAALPADPFVPGAVAPAAGAGQTVEVSTAAVLNGAQITAATAIVTAVAERQMPRDAGIGQLEVLFNLTNEQAEQIMGSAGTTAFVVVPDPTTLAAEEPFVMARRTRSRKLEVPINDETRIVIVGGPRRGKSTLARLYRGLGVPTYCGDPRALVKNPEAGVTYLPAGLSWSGSSRYIAEKWLTMPGPWCCEGVAMARALRKLVAADRAEVLDGAAVIVIEGAHPLATASAGQQAMAKAVWTVWAEIADAFPLAVYLDTTDGVTNVAPVATVSG